MCLSLSLSLSVSLTLDRHNRQGSGVLLYPVEQLSGDVSKVLPQLVHDLLSVRVTLTKHLWVVEVRVVVCGEVK